MSFDDDMFTVVPKQQLYGVKSYKDFYAIQQSVLIGLANQLCPLTLKKPRKQAQKTQVYPAVKTLHFELEDVDIVSVANHICHPLYVDQMNDVRKKQTAQRRFEKNKKVFMQNLLIDILCEKGFFFESKMARQSKKTMRLERIQRVFYKGQLLMDQNTFFERGNIVVTYLNGLFTKGDTLTLSQNDPELMKLFGVFI